MAESSTSFSELIQSLMSGAGTAITSKTVMGEPVVVGETTIIPLSDITIGCGAGARKETKTDGSMGGFGAKVSPAAVLVLKNGVCKVVNIKNQDAVGKLVDMVPDIVDKITAGKEDRDMMDDDDAIEAAFPSEK